MEQETLSEAQSGTSEPGTSVSGSVGKVRGREGILSLFKQFY